MDSQKYFVIWPDGQRFGPADVPTLNMWIGENRINKSTSVEPEDRPGQIHPLEDVPGIVFPEPVPSPDPAHTAQPQDPGAVSLSDMNDPFKHQGSGASSVYGGYDPLKPTGSETSSQQTAQPSGPYNPSTYGQPTQQQPYANYPRQSASADDGSGDITISFVLSAIGFLLTLGTFFFACPLLGLALGIPGIVMASKAERKGHPSSKAAKVVAWIVTVLAGLAQLVIIIGATFIATQVQRDMGF